MEKDRAFENIEKWLPLEEEVAGKYDIPIIAPLYAMPHIDTWNRFCSILPKHPDKSTGVQFFIQDYQFQRVWFKPDLYVPILQEAGVVLSPDFSLYTDMPVAMQVYNHYRKHWCGAYWQSKGIKVIPTIAWSDKNSFDWCFDGEPAGGVVAVSSVGTQRSEDSKRLFRLGYDAMMERLNPETILFWGSVPQGIKGNICPIELFYNYDKHKKKETPKC